MTDDLRGAHQACKKATEEKAAEIPKTASANNTPALERVFPAGKWLNLGKQDNGYTLLISKGIVDKKPYHDKEVKEITWAECSLRQWLNKEYFQTLTPEQRSNIMETEIQNPDNAEYDTPGGVNTKDKIFLLRIDEAKTLFINDEDRVAEYDGQDSWWWLRSPGRHSVSAAHVRYYGGVDSNYGVSIWLVEGVRPAFYVNLL